MENYFVKHKQNFDSPVEKEVVAISDVIPDGVEACTDNRYVDAGCRLSKSSCVSMNKGHTSRCFTRFKSFHNEQ